MATKTPRLLTAREVCEMLGISRSTLGRLIQRGEFSKPLKPSPRTSRWPDQEPFDYIERLKRKNDQSNVEPKAHRSTGINDDAAGKADNEQLDVDYQ